ncbi:recombinase RecT [Cardiobacteriaceae bacterium TAE3-ERU3]|nr:recombinase RecT [Cardiobacteriaceae bacterium TAE3-ERU3]
MGTQVDTIKQLNKMFETDDKIKARISRVVGKNEASFVASVLQIVNNNKQLKAADAKTVISAAVMAATLNLPLNNNLGFAYIVPYNNKKKWKDEHGRQQEQWVTEAQFQLGYKGFIQLAQRSGQFKTIASAPVYEGQLVTENPLTGYEFDWSNKSGVEDAPIGYVAYFKLLNGFEATSYMSDKEVRAHAEKYSKTYNSDFGVWTTNFEAMALKTVLKLLLSKYAPLSIEMQKAVELDQAVVRDIDGNKFDYSDNDVIDAQTVEVATADQVAEIKQLSHQLGRSVDVVCQSYGAAEIESISARDADDAIKHLNAALAKKEAEQNGEIEL